jgi:hypothetical protein
MMSESDDTPWGWRVRRAKGNARCRMKKKSRAGIGEDEDDGRKVLDLASADSMYTLH